MMLRSEGRLVNSLRILIERFPKFFWPHRGISNSSITFKDAKSIKNESTIDQKETQQFYKCTSTPSKRQGTIDVAIIGGGIVPAYTAILLKQVEIIRHIHLIDTKDTLAGSALDASHIDTSTRIKYFKKNCLTEALREVHIIALMDETDFDTGKAGPYVQFMGSSAYVRQIAEAMVRACPTALVAVFARPVTLTLAMVSEIYKCARRWNPDRIIGSTAIDSMRIEAMAANLLDLNPAFLSVPIVGGADACSVVPLLSQARPTNEFTSMQENVLVRRLRSADKELAGTEYRGPKLSSGASAAKLIVTLAGGLCGIKNVISSAFVRSNVLPVCRFFTSELQFGPNGIQKNFGLPKVSPNELFLIEQAIPLINEHVEIAINAVHNEKEAEVKV